MMWAPLGMVLSQLVFATTFLEPSAALPRNNLLESSLPYCFTEAEFTGETHEKEPFVTNGIPRDEIIVRWNFNRISAIPVNGGDCPDASHFQVTVRGASVYQDPETRKDIYLYSPGLPRATRGTYQLAILFMKTQYGKNGTIHSEWRLLEPTRKLEKR